MGCIKIPHQPHRPYIYIDMSVFKGAGGCVVTHLPLTPTARVQLPVALSSLTQAIILLWVSEMCSN